MSETKKYAKWLAEGDTFYANGTWEIVAYTVPEATGGVWVYCISGESYYYLAYVTLRIAVA